MKLSVSRRLLHACAAVSCGALLLVGSPANAGPGRSTAAVDNWPSLSAVQMLDPTHGWAVGGYDGGSVPSVPPIAKHWNGHSWTNVRAVAPRGTKFPQLSQVDTVANGNVWAIGNDGAPTGEVAFADHWLGSSLSLVHFATVPDMYDLYMNGIASTAPHAVWAVGEVDSPTVSGGIIEHWDGSRWSIADETSYGTVLSAVDFAGQTDGWAAGELQPGNGRGQVLADHWDGQHWDASLVSIPGPRRMQVIVTDVVTISPSDAWIIGNSGPRFGSTVPFALHWNGQAWAYHPMDRFSKDLYFVGLTAVNSQDVWAVGNLDVSNYLHQRPVIEHWDGHIWRAVGSPHGETGMRLASVSAVTASNIWAVGSNDSDPTNPLIEHWNGTTWTRWMPPR